MRFIATLVAVAQSIANPVAWMRRPTPGAHGKGTAKRIEKWPAAISAKAQSFQSKWNALLTERAYPCRASDMPKRHEGKHFAMSDIHFHAMGPTRARNGEDPLVPFLLGATDGPVTISARDVNRLDSHRLQILLVAQRKWTSQGNAFAVTDMSPSFRDGLERLGLDSDHFDKETPQ